jgi:hypothetical protein
LTRKKLQRRIYSVVLVLATLGIVAVVLKLEWAPWLSDDDQKQLYELGKDLFPLTVAVLATFLASWFQQRATFLESLRRLWSNLIEAKVEVTSYIAGADRRDERYECTYKAISRSIDEMRGVYRNVGESSQEIGLYPFEPLHDMRKTLEEVGCAPYDSESSTRAIEAVLDAWNSLRPKFLAEFDPPEATYPITEISSHDPRRGRW